KPGDWPDRALVQVLGTPRGRHWGRTDAVAVSPAGDRFASAGRGCDAVFVWDAQTLKPLLCLRTAGVVYGLNFESVRSLLGVTREEIGTRPLLRWRLDTQAVQRVAELRGDRFAFSGSHVLSDVRSTCRLDDFMTNASLWRIARKDAQVLRPFDFCLG